MAGYGAAYFLNSQGIQADLYEKDSYIGGHTATFTFDTGFSFDDGPHISFTKDTRVQEILAESIDGQYETIQAGVNNYYKGYWIKHPAQCNLHGLPEDLVVKCIIDFIENPKVEQKDIHNYEDWLLATFGETFARTFPCEYTKKYHTTTADNMSTVWLGPRLYKPNLEEVLRGALSKQTPEIHYISHFRYPTHDGFVAYLKPLHNKANIHLDHKVESIDPEQKIIGFSNGKQTNYDHLVSSIPLPELIPMITNCPTEVVDAARLLACTSCVTVNVGIDREDISEAHWTYMYDEDFFFTRLCYPHMMSPNMTPEGCGSIQAEVYYSDKYRPIDISPEECIEPVISDLRRCGLIKENDNILHKNARFVKYANVIFDLDRERVLSIVHDYLDSIGIVYVGRYGDWDYHWTDQAFLSGENGAMKLLDSKDS